MTPSCFGALTVKNSPSGKYEPRTDENIPVASGNVTYVQLNFFGGFANLGDRVKYEQVLKGCTFDLAAPLNKPICKELKPGGQKDSIFYNGAFQNKAQGAGKVSACAALAPWCLRYQRIPQHLGSRLVNSSSLYLCLVIYTPGHDISLSFIVSGIVDLTRELECRLNLRRLYGYTPPVNYWEAYPEKKEKPASSPLERAPATCDTGAPAPRLNVSRLRVLSTFFLDLY